MIDERLRVARRAMQRIDWQMGVLLRTFFDLRLHRAFGFPSASRYVAERLGLSGRKARALVAVERGLRRTPALAAAYREGNVSWLRALTLLPVACRDDAWVARAGEVTLRRLVAEVEWALDRRDAGLPTAPPPPGATLAPVERQMCARSASSRGGRPRAGDGGHAGGPARPRGGAGPRAPAPAAPPRPRPRSPAVTALRRTRTLSRRPEGAAAARAAPAARRRSARRDRG